MANNGNSIFEYLIINCGFFRFLLSLHELTYQFFKRYKEFIFHTTYVGDYRSVLLHPLLLRSNGRISAVINDNRDTALIIGSTRSGDKTEEINGGGHQPKWSTAAPLSCRLVFMLRVEGNYHIHIYVRVGGPHWKDFLCLGGAAFKII